MLLPKECVNPSKGWSRHERFECGDQGLPLRWSLVGPGLLWLLTREDRCLIQAGGAASGRGHLVKVQRKLETDSGCVDGFCVIL